MGVISIDRKGEIGMTFNCERMHRAWIDTTGQLRLKFTGS
jgi:isoaspartyl peptidase/L-asparaginase-like protein (Ntn-hydrolase superfamily)